MVHVSTGLDRLSRTAADGRGEFFGGHLDRETRSGDAAAELILVL